MPTFFHAYCLLSCNSPQAEVAAYNERERCFDDFSNLLHSYQVIARSDVDGSRTSAFWQTVLTPEGLKVESPHTAAALQPLNSIH